jgi:hypothetical protein
MSPPILEALPPPGQIRARLSEITQEANFLRRLLRLIDHRPRRRERPSHRAADGRPPRESGVSLEP